MMVMVMMMEEDIPKILAYLLTRKERKRKTPKCIQYANDKSWQQSRISYLPEVSRDIHETFCNCQVKISLGSIIHDSFI